MEKRGRKGGRGCLHSRHDLTACYNCQTVYSTYAAVQKCVEGLFFFFAPSAMQPSQWHSYFYGQSAGRRPPVKHIDGAITAQHSTRRCVQPGAGHRATPLLVIASSMMLLSRRRRTGSSSDFVVFWPKCGVHKPPAGLDAHRCTHMHWSLGSPLLNTC